MIPKNPYDILSILWPKSDLRKLQKNLHGSDGSWRFFSKSWRRAAFDDVAGPDMASSQPGPASKGPTLCWNNHGFLTRCSIARLPSSDWWQKIARSFPQNLSSSNICFFPWVFPKNLQVELISCTCHGQGLALFVVAWALFLRYSIGDAASKVGGSTTV